MRVIYFQAEEEASGEEMPLVRPSVSFATEDPDQAGQMLLVSLAYWKPSEKLTVVIMKGRNLKLIDKNRKPGKWLQGDPVERHRGEWHEMSYSCFPSALFSPTPLRKLEYNFE